MENEINISPKPKTPKKFIAARVILTLAVSAALSFMAYALWAVASSPFPVTDFYSAVRHMTVDPLFISLLVAFGVMLILSIIQSFIGKKIGASIVEMLIPCAIALVVSGVLALIDRELFGVISTTVLITAFRCLFLIIDLLIRKKGKFIPICIVAALFFAVLSPVIYSLEDEFLQMGAGEPDRTSSWAGINQQLNRGEDWEQIVTDSQFQLGEIKPDPMFEEDDGFYIQPIGTYPSMDGSTVCVPLAVEFARQHLGFTDEEASSFVYFYTTHDAYISLISETGISESYISDEKYISVKSEHGPDIILVTEPSEEELKVAKLNGVEFVSEPVCYDAFVFITHKDNPVESLTVQQIRDIYSGKITNWKEVGGRNEKIKAYQRNANSGSQTAMENLVMGGVGMIDPITVTVVSGMAGLIETVAEYDNESSSIGYTYKYYIDTLYKNDDIKTIAIEGVEPTEDNIRSEKYPFSTNYYGVIRKGDEENIGGKFLDWILSDEGQKCVKQAGYIPMKTDS